jgi:hypothetical protein
MNKNGGPQKMNDRSSRMIHPGTTDQCFTVYHFKLKFIIYEATILPVFHVLLKHCLILCGNITNCKLLNEHTHWTLVRLN